MLLIKCVHDALFTFLYTKSYDMASKVQNKAQLIRKSQRNFNISSYYTHICYKQETIISNNLIILTNILCLGIGYAGHNLDRNYGKIKQRNY